MPVEVPPATPPGGGSISRVIVVTVMAMEGVLLFSTFSEN